MVGKVMKQWENIRFSRKFESGICSPLRVLVLEKMAALLVNCILSYWPSPLVEKIFSYMNLFRNPMFAPWSNLLSGQSFLTQLTLKTCYKSTSFLLFCLLICMLCCSSSETVSHLFLHCSPVNYLWNKLFKIFGENWVCTQDLRQFLLNEFRSFWDS